MAVSDLIQQARARFGSSPSVVLRADQPTGEKPWEMFVTDEHTEHYLSLKVGGDSDRGLVTGLLGGGVSLVMLIFALIFLIKGEWDGVVITSPFSIIFFVFPSFGKRVVHFPCLFCLIVVPVKSISTITVSYTTPRGMVPKRLQASLCWWVRILAVCVMRP